MTTSNPFQNLPKPPPHFVLDVHLGKLARHLRMLGFDSCWKESLTDPELETIALRENRILLTRDRALHKNDLTYYVAAIEPGRQLLEVLERFSLSELVRSGRGFLSRCLECNAPIVPAKPHQVHHLLPGSLLLEHDEFLFCPHCERVYCKGSHFDRMRKWVQDLLKSA